MISGSQTQLLINLIRRSVVREAFQEGIGHRTFFLTAAFPFMYIGKIAEVVSDFVYIDIETTHISELEERTMRVHIDDIDVFYIENGGVRIPKIC